MERGDWVQELFRQHEVKGGGPKRVRLSESGSPVVGDGGVVVSVT